MTCGVSMQICTTGPGSLRGQVEVGAGEPLGQSVSPLGEDSPAVERGGQPVGVRRLREIALEREAAAFHADRCRAGAQRVEQRGGGELGRDVHADLGTETGLGEAGYGRLGDDEEPCTPRGTHRRTRAKSRAVRSVPVTEPETLERVPSARGW